jgi:hypothetical protein
VNWKSEILSQHKLKILIVMILMGFAIPLTGQDKEEKSAISAIKSGNLELFKSYLELHPDLNCGFSNGKTGLYYAIEYDQFIITKYLLDRGADPNFIINDYSMLNWAIRNNMGRITRLLIEFGAGVNKEDDNQNTPLIYAAELNNLDICKILIDRGADPLHANLKRKRASDYAFFYDGSPAYKYLLKMEKQCQEQDSIPSMRDGPYIYWETDNRIVLTYYERDQDKNLTRLIEKTMEIGIQDTVVTGFGWDKNSYHISKQYTPDPDKIETAGDIFAVGDVHGKYNALVSLLINNKIIGPDRKWIFGNGHLVLMGDVFDRGAAVTEVLWFLYDLEFQAKDSGGDVHLLLGNHEIMAMTGDDRYLNGKYDYFTRYTRVYYYQLIEKNTVLGRWLRSLNLIMQVNDNLFVHAGISPEFAEYNYDYSDINIWVRNYLYSDYRTVDGSPEDIILGAIGPQWYRGYMYLNTSLPEITQQFVDDYLNSLSLKRMILGHNEQRTINASFQGKIISADISFDEEGKSAQGLLISRDMLYRCFSDGSRERIE